MNGSEITLLQANIGMGLNHQDSLKQGITSMGAYFLASNPDFFRKNAEVQSYCNFIRRNSPDIIYLTEVCGIDQMELLSDSLIGMGYNIHIIQGFELWNMDHESHRYLYHIMATRSNFVHKKTIQQFTSNYGTRFMRWKNGLGKPIPDTSHRIDSILDGAGSHYQIDGIEFGFMHAHANDSVDVFSGLLEDLRYSNNLDQILAGDMNMSIENSRVLTSRINPELRLVETHSTYPYYFQRSSKGLITETIDRIMKKYFLSHPDQLYYSGNITVLGSSVLGPIDTNLKTDHSVNVFRFRK